MWANESFAAPASSSAGDLDEICNTVYPWGIASATWPFASPSLEYPGAAAVDEGLDKGVDGPLDGGSNKDLFEVVLAFKRQGRVGPVTGCGASPYLLEYDASQESTKDRAGEADRTVKDPRGLAGFFLFRHWTPTGPVNRWSCNALRCGGLSLGYRWSVVDRLRSSSFSRAWSRSTRTRCTSCACLASALSRFRVSRAGSWIVSSAATPDSSSRPRSSSASSSAPKRRARLVSHSHSKNTMTPANAP